MRGGGGPRCLQSSATSMTRQMESDMSSSMSSSAAGERGSVVALCEQGKEGELSTGGERSARYCGRIAADLAEVEHMGDGSVGERFEVAGRVQPDDAKQAGRISSCARKAAPCVNGRA